MCRYGLKPARRKRDVVAQLMMLTEGHAPVSEEQLERVMSRGSKKLRAQENMDALDRLLENE